MSLICLIGSKASQEIFFPGSECEGGWILWFISLPPPTLRPILMTEYIFLMNLDRKYHFVLLEFLHSQGINMWIPYTTVCPLISQEVLGFIFSWVVLKNDILFRVSYSHS